MKNSFAANQRLRTWRESSGLKRADIAAAFKESNKEIGSSYQAIKDIEDGNRTINIDHLDILMKIFNLNPLWVLTGDGEMLLGNDEDVGIVAEPRAVYGKPKPRSYESWEECGLCAEKDARIADLQAQLSTLREVIGLMKGGREAG